MPNLFFIQSKSDIDFINSKIKTNRKDLYISCNHIAYYECQKKNIHTIPFENYLDRDSFVKNRHKTIINNLIFNSFRKPNSSY